MNSEIFYQNQFIKSLYFYSSVLIVPMGILLNLIQIRVFSSKEFTKSNIGFLMNTFVILQSLALIWTIIVFRYLTVIGINISNLSEFTCVTFLNIVRIIQEIPLFFQTFVSFINYLSVAYPSMYKIFLKKRNIIFCLIGIIIFIFVANIPNLFRNIVTLNTTNLSNTQICIATNQADMISSIDFALFRFFIPFILFILINILSIKTIMKSKRNLKVTLKKEIAFSKVLIYLGCLFFLFNFPLSFIVIIQIIYQYFISSSTSQLNYINFLIDCSRIFAWSYYGCGFFINSIFNKRFRKILIQIIVIKDSINSAKYFKK